MFSAPKLYFYSCPNRCSYWCRNKCLCHYCKRVSVHFIAAENSISVTSSTTSLKPKMIQSIKINKFSISLAHSWNCYILMRHFLELCSSWSPWWSRTASGPKTRSEQQLLGFKEREVEKEKANSDPTAAQLTIGGAVLSSTAIYTWLQIQINKCTIKTYYFN